MEVNNLIINFDFSLIALSLVNIALIIIVMFIAFSRNLLNIAILFAIFSLIMAIEYILLDAPDVGITEASVGACISTIYVLLGIVVFGTDCKKVKLSIKKIPIIICLTLGFIISLAFIAYIPLLGSPESPAHNGINRFYIENTGQIMGMKSIVTGILASFRGFDTLFEACVIFTALMSISLIAKIEK